MGNSLCSSKCISEGSSLDTAVGKCQKDKIKELIDAAVERQLKGLEKPDDDVTKPDILNDLP